MAKIFREVGVSGLKQWGGHIDEEWLQKLKGDRGRRFYREMADNDSTIGALLFAIEALLRNVEWRVEPFSDAPQHKEQAEFVESLMTDLSHTWEDMIAEILSMLVWGYAPLEICYKRREGPDQRDPTRRSKHDDGLIGWRKLPIRAQETIEEWIFDDDGGIQGFRQLPPEGGFYLDVPIEKALLFRTTSRKNSPEGRSVLRNAAVAYYHKTRIAENESIGIERDLAGMPVFYLPPEMFDPDNAEGATQLAEYRRIIENIKNDEQAGLLLPAIFDENKNRIVDFQLAGTGSRRLFDTSAIIQRWDRSMAMTVLADFIFLGHEKVGSFALSSDKTTLFATALGGWLKEIASVLNRHGVSRLYRINGWNASEAAEYVPQDVEKIDITDFAESVNKLTLAGWLTPGSIDDEDHLRDFLDMPGTPDDVEGLRPPNRDHLRGPGGQFSPKPKDDDDLDDDPASRSPDGGDQ